MTKEDIKKEEKNGFQIRDSRNDSGDVVPHIHFCHSRESGNPEVFLSFNISGKNNIDS
jgi:hypothetical protein